MNGQLIIMKNNDKFVGNIIHDNNKLICHIFIYHEKIFFKKIPNKNSHRKSVQNKLKNRKERIIEEK